MTLIALWLIAAGTWATAIGVWSLVSKLRADAEWRRSIHKVS